MKPRTPWPRRLWMRRSRKTFEEAAGKVSLQSVGPDGLLSDPLALLRLRGFTIGSYAQPARFASGAGAAASQPVPAGSFQQIVGIEGAPVGLVVLQSGGPSGVIQKEPVRDFLDKWGLASSADIVELHPGWPSKRPHLIEPVQALEPRGQIVAALGHVAVKCVGVEDSVRVYSRPRKVEAARDFAVGALVLFPETNSVKTQPAASATEDLPLQEVTFIPPDESRRHFLSPAVANECVAPYWMVAFVDVPAEANMELYHVVAQGLLGHDFVPPGVVIVRTPSPPSQGVIPGPPKKKRKAAAAKPQPAKKGANAAAAKPQPAPPADEPPTDDDAEGEAADLG